MKTILITGINGFLGSNLAKTLKKEYNIIGLEYSLDNLYRIKDEIYKVYSVENGIPHHIFTENKIDIVIHTATVYRNTDDSIYNMLQTNIVLPAILYELANKYNAEAFINTDSFFNNPNHSYSYLGEYTLTKKHVLEWLKTIQKETKLINMKLFHMYGPDDSPNKFVTQIINDLKNNKPTIELTPGQQKRDFIYIDDVVYAYQTVISNLGEISNSYIEFEVGTGKAITLKQFVETTAQVTKSKSKLLFGAIKYREGEIMLSEADNSKLLELAWEPKTNIIKGLKMIINNKQK